MPEPVEGTGPGGNRDAPGGDGNRRERPVWKRQFLKFIAVGLFNTAVELTVYNLLLLIHNPHSLSMLSLYSTLGVGAAIANSYAWNTRWAFKQSRARRGRGALRQRALFLTQSVVNIGINDAVTIVLTPLLVGIHLLPLVVAQNLAKTVAMTTASVSSYLMLRRFVFPSAGTSPG